MPPLPSAKKRAELYDQLGVYLDAGTPIQQALSSLCRSSNFSVRSVCQQALDGTMNGLTFADALALSKPAIPKFEQAVLHAAELSGRLPVGCRLLHETLTRWGNLKWAAVAGSIYPAFMIHACIFIVPFPAAFVSGDMGAYLRTVGLSLLSLYSLILIPWFLIVSSKRSGGPAALVVEKLIRCIPVVGKTWWSMVVSRFSMAYDGMLNTGSNVLDALEVASHAANSVILRQKIAAIIPHIKQGEPVGPWLQANQVLGNPWEEFWITGEQSGKQEEMLRRIVTQSTLNAERGVSLLTKGLPKIILIGTVLFVFFQILKMVYSTIVPYYQQVDDLMK